MKKGELPKVGFQSNRIGFITLAATTILAIGATILSFSFGYFIIVQNLFYFPIILACIYYTRRGFAFSVIIACIYFILTVAFTHDSEILLQAFVRVLIFILVAGVITYLSSGQKRLAEKLRQQRDHLEDLIHERTWQLEKDITERKQAEHALSERYKELRCLYNIDEISSRTEFNDKEIYKKVINVLPQAWQYPEITVARLTLHGKKFETKNYRDTEWKQSADINIYGVKAGEVEVNYLKKRPELDEGPFMKEERYLINSIAEQLARITETKQVEEEHLKVIEYRELDKLKTNLLSTVSHELRTPLAGIKGYTTLLLDYYNKLKRKQIWETLKAIDSSTDRLTELIEHLLDMSRLDAGLLRLNLETVKPSDIFLAAVSEAKLRAPNYKFKTEINHQLPMITADVKRLRQVIDNLLDNAIKYSPEGIEITVRAKINAEELLVCVADQGMGIPAAEVTKIFDRM